MRFDDFYVYSLAVGFFLFRGEENVLLTFSVLSLLT
jgi:hypothetical protein